MKKKKARVGSDIKSLNETADALCLKADATGKLAFVMQANSLKKTREKTAKEKVQELADLEANINATLIKLK